MEERKVILKINGEEIPLNSFVQGFISATSLGMVSSFKKEEEDLRKIEIVIEFENETES